MMYIKTLFLFCFLIFHSSAAEESEKQKAQPTVVTKPSLHCLYCKDKLDCLYCKDKDVPWIGLFATAIDKALASQLSIKNGCTVLYTMPNGAVDKSGIQKFDVITSFDGKKVMKFRDFKDILKRKSVGDKVEVQLIRGGKRLTKSITLITKPIAATEATNSIEKVGKVVTPKVQVIVVDEQKNDIKLTPIQQKEMLSQLIPNTNNNLEKLMLEKANKEGGYDKRLTKSIETVYCKGSIIIELNQGERKIIAKDLEGVIQYEGNFNTEEDKKKIPADLLKRIESLLIIYNKLLK